MLWSILLTKHIRRSLLKDVWAESLSELRHLHCRAILLLTMSATLPTPLCQLALPTTPAERSSRRQHRILEAEHLHQDAQVQVCRRQLQGCVNPDSSLRYLSDAAKIEMASWDEEGQNHIASAAKSKEQKTADRNKNAKAFKKDDPGKDLPAHLKEEERKKERSEQLGSV
jgi:hypothetical protein